MGSLRAPDGLTLWLQPRTLVGRSPLATWVLAEPTVSSEHAVLWFDNGSWWVRDTGSRNGTFVDGRRLDGPVRLARGARVSFGAGSTQWILVDDTAPRVSAQAIDDQTLAVGQGRLLLLPNPVAPLALIECGPTGAWEIEQGERRRPVRHGDIVQVAGRSWELRLPVASQATALAAPTEQAARTVDVRHSLDEEHVEVTLGEGANTYALAPRTHSALWLTLARAWSEDNDAPPAARGLVHADVVCRQLRIDRDQLNQWVFRTRRDQQAAGLEGASFLTRRLRTHQLRLTADSVTVSLLGRPPR